MMAMMMIMIVCFCLRIKMCYYLKFAPRHHTLKHIYWFHELSLSLITR